MWYFVATMPPKANYWKHFKVVGVVAYCLVAECQQPNISLGALPKVFDCSSNVHCRGASVLCCGAHPGCEEEQTRSSLG